MENRITNETKKNHNNGRLLNSQMSNSVISLSSMAFTYTINEKIQFVKWYFAGNSVRQIRDLLSGLFPERPIPTVSTIQKIISNFNKTGSVIKLCTNCTKNVVVVPNENERILQENDDLNEINVLAAIHVNKNASVREIGHDLNISFSAVQKILKKHHYKSYKYENHQEIFEDDRYHRMIFCETVMELANQDRYFISNICFTDECTFTLNGEPNKQNHRYWSKEKQPLVTQTHSQYPRKLNVWAGILGENIIGPFFIEGYLDSAKYVELLQNEIGPAIDQVVNDDKIIWFQQDGCPAHYGRDVQEYLNNVYPNFWIGRGGTITWPPRSPDLSPYYII